MAGNMCGEWSSWREKPVLFRQSLFDVGEGGQRTLVIQHAFVEYRVLPEGAVAPTIEVPPPTHPADPEECPDMDMRAQLRKGADGSRWVGVGALKMLGLGAGLTP